MGFFRDVERLEQTDPAGPDEHHPRRAAPNQHQREVQRLMATGIIAQATVQALRDTGRTFGEHPQVEFDLLVSLPGSEPYAVTHVQPISRIVLANFRPGAQIPVRVDPADAHRVLIG